MKTLSKKVTSAIWRRLEQTPSVDLEPRWDDAFSHVTALVVEALTANPTSSENPLPLLAQWRSESAAAAVALTRQVREAFWAAESSPTAEFLGKSRALYSFVRETVGVKARRGDVFLGKQEATIGSSISKIYDSVKSGRINSVLVDIMA
jgi:phenylalanine ammonia-lyase